MKEEEREKFPQTSLFHPAEQFFGKEETLLTTPPPEMK